MFDLLFTLLIVVYNPDTGDLQAYRQQNLTSQQCFSYKESFLPSSFLSSIWQPPKSC